MKNLEPGIIRQRIIIEGKYTIDITEEVIKEYLVKLAERFKMTPLIEPVIFSPNIMQHPIHHGIAGFLAWVRSGVAIYTWDHFKFFSIDIHTCEIFLVAEAVKFTKEFFKTTEIEYQEIKF